MPQTPRMQKGLTAELADLDKELVEVLLKRSRLLGRSAADRRDRNLSLVDAGQERRLWETWQQALQDRTPVTRTWRLLFNLANELAYGFNEPGQGQSDMLLEPSRAPVRIRSAAPADLESTRLWLAAAAMSPSAFTLAPVVLNDPLFELIKALNQLDAGLSWEGTSIASSEERARNTGGVVFVGEDPLNLYILLCLCAATTGTTKFSGGTALKVADLRIMRDVLVQIGARTSFLTPKGYGLPLRLEASGVVQGDIQLEDNVPRELGMALALTAPTFSNGLTLRWEEGWTGVTGIEKVASILQKCGVPITFESLALHIPSAQLAVPDRPEIDMDCLLATSILALSQVTGGRVELMGHWPAGTIQADTCSRLLESYGTRLSIEEKSILSQPGSAAKTPVLDVDAVPGLLPLAVAFALLLPQGAEIRCSTTTFEVPAALEFLETLDQSFALENGTLRVNPPSPLQRKRTALTPPHALWSMAAALVAFRYPGLEVTNPGDMGRLWPRFWSVYRRLPTPGDLMAIREKKLEKPQPKEEQQDVKKRKRYIVE